MNRNRPYNLLVLTYWSYKDALIQAYTLPYLHIILDQLPKGSTIYLVTLEQDRFQLSPNEFAQVRARLRFQGIRLIRIRYRKFGLLSLLNGFFMILRMIGLIVFRRIRTIHAWCTPAGAFAYILSCITGKRLIIDSYEPHAEAMVENGTWKRDGLQYRLLFYMERKLSNRASILISATEGMREYARSRYGVVKEKFFVKPACVNLGEFSPRMRKREELVRQFNLQGKIVCVYAGKFGGIYLDKEVFQFFRVAQEFWGDRFHAFLLTSHDPRELVRWAGECGFDTRAMTVRFVSHDTVPEYMGLGDFAITPVKPIPTKRYCTPIKDGEYWSLGLPVVIPPGISDDSGIIEQHRAGAIIERLDREHFLKALQVIDDLLRREPTEEQRKRIHQIAVRYRDFEISRKIYSYIYGERSDASSAA